MFLNALILTKYVIIEEVDRHFNLSSEVLNDDITKRYHVDDYFKIELSNFTIPTNFENYYELNYKLYDQLNVLTTVAA